MPGRHVSRSFQRRTASVSGQNPSRPTSHPATDANGTRRDLPPAAYAELRRQASALLRRERGGHTLQTTALAHEAYLRLAEQRSVPWSAADQFAVAAAVTIRRVLVDHARADKALKRGRGRRGVRIDAAEIADTSRQVDLVELDDCLGRLETLHPRQARVVDLRFFAGLPIERIADLLGVSEPTVRRDWRWARAWLRRELDLPDSASPNGDVP